MAKRVNQMVREMAQERSAHVLMESTRAAIEKMAEEFARDMLADPQFRAYLREEATRAARQIAGVLDPTPAKVARRR